MFTAKRAVARGSIACCPSRLRFALSHIYGLLEGPPTIRGLVRFKNGVEFIRDFSVLDQLAPYDVLIGRDILRECRMYIDLGRGHFRLYFANRTPRRWPADGRAMPPA